MPQFFAYMLRCSDGTLYTGWSTDIAKRTAQHNAGKGAKYTRARLPVVCVYSESFDAKKDAMKREYEIKQLSRARKERLIQSK
ncbi:MAG: endonuclease [Candidatus Andersenbacteria bacterium RIFCSPHIGHO2_12_FULL_45_11b]|uniref:Endonuclease n=1 Tax=Candidatus Andersenbacteria bacterium RIFCSPHIGHO2_12_FULL_45_11b TaxID=1797282 RepID=A0A1G1X6F3_9BACT|nr:MAG: endonuclease [Candidatus Andersenbacteria bacterium RIFCSPHIGHO2_12_FULL_45_11b]